MLFSASMTVSASPHTVILAKDCKWHFYKSTLEDQDICKIYGSQKDRNNAFHTKPSAIKSPYQIKAFRMHIDNVIAEFSTREFLVPCSNDSVNTGSGEVTVFVWTIKLVMNGRAKDYLSLTPKKAPVPIQCDGFMMCRKRLPSAFRWTGHCPEWVFTRLCHQIFSWTPLTSSLDMPFSIRSLA